MVDAIVPGAALTLDLCAELRRLAPFGLGNPGVTLLVAGCELVDLTTVGEGKHLRFRVRDARGAAGTAIAFGLGSQLDRCRRVGHYDVAFRLQENTLERDDLAAARRPADLRDARALPRAARALRRGVARR